MGGGDRLGKNAELSIPDFAGEPYFLGNFQKCFFSMRALFPFIFPEILIQAKGRVKTAPLLIVEGPGCRGSPRGRQQPQT